jgi:uncharacterized membrane protein
VANYDQVFWLNVTNIILGLVTLACVLVIGFAAVREVRQRAKAKERIEVDDHSFVVSGLGVTMADGGKKTDDDEMLVVTEDGIETVSKKKDSTKR